MAPNLYQNLIMAEGIQLQTCKFCSGFKERQFNFVTSHMPTSGRVLFYVHWLLTHWYIFLLSYVIESIPFSMQSFAHVQVCWRKLFLHIDISFYFNIFALFQILFYYKSIFIPNVVRTFHYSLHIKLAFTIIIIHYMLYNVYYFFF